MTEIKDDTRPTVTITTTVEKFAGEYNPGDTPVEVVTTTETVPLADVFSDSAQITEQEQ